MPLLSQLARTRGISEIGLGRVEMWMTNRCAGPAAAPARNLIVQVLPNQYLFLFNPPVQGESVVWQLAGWHGRRQRATEEDRRKPWGPWGKVYSTGSCLCFPRTCAMQKNVQVSNRWSQGFSCPLLRLVAGQGRRT